MERKATEPKPMRYKYDQDGKLIRVGHEGDGGGEKG
jgi:YD repeat-containing protein